MEGVTQRPPASSLERALQNIAGLQTLLFGLGRTDRCRKHNLSHPLLQVGLEEREVLGYCVVLAGLKESQKEEQRLMWTLRLQLHPAGHLVCYSQLQDYAAIGCHRVSSPKHYSPQACLWSASLHCKEKDKERCLNSQPEHKYPDSLGLPHR